MHFRIALPLLVIISGCVGSVRVPRGVTLPIRAKVAVRADVRVEAPPPPPAHNVIVEIQSAPVPEFFGIPLDNASDVVFVLDISGSMDNFAQGRLSSYSATPTTPPPPGPVEDPNQPPPPPTAAPAPKKIEVAKAELVDALAKLPLGTRVNVIFFNSDLDALAADVEPLSDQSRDGMIKFVSSVGASGSTALAPAMRAAFLMNAKRIVLLSDGLGNVGGGADSVLKDAREAMRGGVRIDTIGLGAGQDGSLLSSLAGESGGLYQAL
jgi:von Willebrand factor type A domain